MTLMQYDSLGTVIIFCGNLAFLPSNSLVAFRLSSLIITRWSGWINCAMHRLMRFIGTVALKTVESVFLLLSRFPTVNHMHGCCQCASFCSEHARSHQSSLVGNQGLKCVIPLSQQALHVQQGVFITVEQVQLGVRPNSFLTLKTSSDTMVRHFWQTCECAWHVYSYVLGLSSEMPTVSHALLEIQVLSCLPHQNHLDFCWVGSPRVKECIDAVYMLALFGHLLIVAKISLLP